MALCMIADFPSSLVSDLAFDRDLGDAVVLAYPDIDRQQADFRMVVRLQAGSSCQAVVVAYVVLVDMHCVVVAVVVVDHTD